MPVWNINSFAEYFLQIFTQFSKEYKIACNKIAEQRNILQNNLREISYLKVYPSQANYIMCEVTGKFTSKELAKLLIKNNNILIKDLSQKRGFLKKQYIRIAVRDKEDNNKIFEVLKRLDV